MTAHLVVGEVHTGLLMHSSMLPEGAVPGLLDLVPGERVRWAERPMARAVSADLARAVDCPLAVASGPRGRGLGTVLARARLVGGRVIQASVRARLVCNAERRRPWGHYLARLGDVEVLGKADAPALADGFIADADTDADAGLVRVTLDTGAVCESLLMDLQRAPALDHRPTMRTRRTRLRWSARRDPDAPVLSGRFTVVDETLRTLSLHLPADTAFDPADLAALCEDLAHHDWLLTTAGRVAEQACTGAADPTALRRLRPVVDHLLHLWTPGTDVAPALLPAWDALEARPGFSRQWQTTVSRIRAFLALDTT
ncbi:SCO2521 family protein [Yinghuangia seranimata]|uniref:SCO2521 family protein n=1 Tax=Yinghuangia seranimata TaxID=408067 RepID=UPI00248B8BAA|nr:SCO2521 family protein [Yinghuangia seranimata]MDI2129019.1 SCO2521 family protein [Yinghuangia seranimata]